MPANRMRLSATWRWPIGARSAASAMDAGKIPPDTMPEIIRRTSSIAKLVATALANPANVRSRRQAVITRTLPHTSAIGPSSGCSTA